MVMSFKNRQKPSNPSNLQSLPQATSLRVIALYPDAKALGSCISQRLKSYQQIITCLLMVEYTLLKNIKGTLSRHNLSVK